MISTFIFLFFLIKNIYSPEVPFSNLELSCPSTLKPGSEFFCAIVVYGGDYGGSYAPLSVDFGNGQSVYVNATSRYATKNNYRVNKTNVNSKYVYNLNYGSKGNLALSLNNEAQESGNLIAVEFYSSLSGSISIWAVSFTNCDSLGSFDSCASLISTKSELFYDSNNWDKLADITSKIGYNLITGNAAVKKGSMIEFDVNSGNIVIDASTVPKNSDITGIYAFVTKSLSQIKKIRSTVNSRIYARGFYDYELWNTGLVRIKYDVSGTFVIKAEILETSVNLNVNFESRSLEVAYSNLILSCPSECKANQLISCSLTVNGGDFHGSIAPIKIDFGDSTQKTYNASSPYSSYSYRIPTIIPSLNFLLIGEPNNVFNILLMNDEFLLAGSKFLAIELYTSSIGSIEVYMNYFTKCNSLSTGQTCAKYIDGQLPGSLSLSKSTMIFEKNLIAGYNLIENTFSLTGKNGIPFIKLTLIDNYLIDTNTKPTTGDVICSTYSSTSLSGCSKIKDSLERRIYARVFYDYQSSNMLSFTKSFSGAGLFSINAYVDGYQFIQGTATINVVEDEVPYSNLKLTCGDTAKTGELVACNLTVYGGDFGGSNVSILVNYGDGTSEELIAQSPYKDTNYRVPNYPSDATNTYSLNTANNVMLILNDEVLEDNGKLIAMEIYSGSIGSFNLKLNSYSACSSLKNNTLCASKITTFMSETTAQSVGLSGIILITGYNLIKPSTPQTVTKNSIPAFYTTTFGSVVIDKSTSPTFSDIFADYTFYRIYKIDTVTNRRIYLRVFYDFQSLNRLTFSKFYETSGYFNITVSTIGGLILKATEIVRVFPDVNYGNLTLNCPLVSATGIEVVCNLTVSGGILGGGSVKVRVLYSDGSTELLNAVSPYSINKYTIPRNSPIGTDFDIKYSFPDYVKLLLTNNEVEKDGLLLGVDFYSNNYARVEIYIVSLDVCNLIGYYKSCTQLIFATNPMTLNYNSQRLYKIYDAKPGLNSIRLNTTVKKYEFIQVALINGSILIDTTSSPLFSDLKFSYSSGSLLNLRALMDDKKSRLYLKAFYDYQLINQLSIRKTYSLIGVYNITALLDEDSTIKSSQTFRIVNLAQANVTTTQSNATEPVDIPNNCYYQKENIEVLSLYDSEYYLDGFTYVHNSDICLKMCNQMIKCNILVIFKKECRFYKKSARFYLGLKNESQLYQRKINDNYEKLYTFNKTLLEYDGLLNNWPIWNNLVDYIGFSDIILGPNSSFSTDRFGNQNSAIKLENGYCLLPNANYIHGDFSITLWIKVNSIIEWHTLLEIGNGENEDMVVIYMSGNLVGFNDYSPQMDIYSDGFVTSIASNVKITTGRWTFLVFTLHNDTASIYIDGFLVGLKSNMNIPENTFKKVNYLGKSSLNSLPLNNNLDIDEVKFFDKSLDIDDINYFLSGENMKYVNLVH